MVTKTENYRYLSRDDRARTRARARDDRDRDRPRPRLAEARDHQRPRQTETETGRGPRPPETETDRDRDWPRPETTRDRDRPRPRLAEARDREARSRYTPKCHISEILEMSLRLLREMPYFSREMRAWVWGTRISKEDLTSLVTNSHISRV
jgi:hypothetical protein